MPSPVVHNMYVIDVAVAKVFFFFRKGKFYNKLSRLLLPFSGFSISPCGVLKVEGIRAYTGTAVGTVMDGRSRSPD